MTQTAFKPEVHGLAFVNRWEFDEEERERLHKTFAGYLTLGAILGAAAFGLPGALLVPAGILALRRQMESHLAPVYGLCGGMCFAALDFFLQRDGPPIPRGEHREDRPATGTSMRRYLWKRQLDSLVSDGARFLAWLIALNYLPRSWPFRGGPEWLLARSREEWQKLKASVDEGRPVPIGLVREAKNVYDNHQVLAVSYEETDEAHGTIYLYEPNCPDRVSTIQIEFGERGLEGRESCAPSARLRGFFCETYTFSNPAGAISRGPAPMAAHIEREEGIVANVGIFYGSTTGHTESVAQRIQKALGAENAALHDVASASADDLERYDYLIFGVATYSYGDLQDDWKSFAWELDRVDFSGKKVALFGVGDQERFPDTFVNGMGTIYRRVTERGATVVGSWPTDGTVVGSWPTDGYSFNTSTAVQGGSFVGLAIDEHTQPELTDERVARWVDGLRGEFD